MSLLTRLSQRFYKSYRIAKRTSGWRNISQPSKELKGIQAWILRNILDKLSPSDYATAYLPGKSLNDNVMPHAGNRYFLSVDIENFFHNIPDSRVQRVFELVGYSKPTARFLMSLCAYFHHLPQGGVTSPALSNLVSLRLDARLSGLMSRRNIVFTRYADDMTFSANSPRALIKALRSIRRIVLSEGFLLNEPKTRVLGPRCQCAITGLIKNASEPRFGIGRKKKVKMRAVMHGLVSGKRVDPKYPTTEAVEGWLNFVKGTDKISHRQMSEYWKRLREKYPIPVTMERGT